MPVDHVLAQHKPLGDVGITQSLRNHFAGRHAAHEPPFWTDAHSVPITRTATQIWVFRLRRPGGANAAVAWGSGVLTGHPRNGLTVFGAAGGGSSFTSMP
ncbi:MAG TPA: hypothetical protein VGI05_17665 [Streptosporangiaceae bacterium]